VARIETEVAPPASFVPEDPPVESSWNRIDVVLLILLVLFAGFLRFNNVDQPDDLMFDEVYYAADSCSYVLPEPECDLEETRNEVHPPLGKWMISVGIQLFGYDSFGYRMMAALAGSMTVALLYLLGRRLMGSAVAAVISAGLLAIDFLHIVQSRIAMLDIFVPFFGTAAFLFLVIDRDKTLRALEDGVTTSRRLLGRPWLLASGAMAGACVATKWSGGLVLLSVLILACVWEISVRRRLGDERWLSKALREAAPQIALCLVILPTLVYLATYVGRLQGDVLSLPWSDGSWLRAFFDEQKEMLDFHMTLDGTHHYQSPAWSWLALRRPVAYFYEDVGGGNVREIMAFGSPFVWWASIAALAFTFFRWLPQRNMYRPEGVILAGFAVGYLPWLLPFIGRDAMFLFYLLPVTPFMCLALGYALTSIGWTWEARAAQTLFVAGALAAFAYFQPLLYNSTVSREKWDSRIWFDDVEKGCKRPIGTPSETTVTETIDGKPSEVTSQTNDNSSLPPVGWCWI
jgi:dolichyl-phosphate-mannose-protein mannosyltransferase